MSCFFFLVSIVFISVIFISSGAHLFPLFLLLDVLMFFLLSISVFSNSSIFILILVFCVFSAGLGITLLMSSVRNTGQDNVFALF